ncbi:MAG: hypothetical protein UY81_C0006G0015 [Candidatus Giovannonibacteria bacterium GW2011_GWA2_53_7]|uniref:Dockerin domain-containing protein n=1 Tax=Candidatus Giovannonibacteria bacterium GW2011_GWA2_53_7 TaxID=1618650 RepID=A0A0G1Y1D5_9BACT|nr:MAG: hypothetical protein UY81_C0006G0015 [Candidatus Giovannonibacteria bacterium GW2011_GWA2_53_7]
MRFHNFFKTHRYKILVGTPIVFLLIMNSAEVLESENRYTIVTDGSPFVLVDKTVHLTLIVNSNAPVNALGGTITFPKDVAVVEKVTREPSTISLWSEEPIFSNTDGELKFSGGIPNGREALKNAPILTLDLRMLKPGKVVLRMKNGMLLANNGKGTNIFSGQDQLITLWIREPDAPSPDINNDGTLSIADVNMLYLKTFRSNDPRYDLNRDGKVNWGDVKFLALMTSS